MGQRKICVVVGSRANYSSIKTAMTAVAEHPNLQLQVVVGASALLDRFGSVVNLIEQDGFEIDEKVFMLVEGDAPNVMATSTGLGLIELSTIFERLGPDVVVTVGDRFETMATALAAAYMNIPLAHTMGGEISGTIDESIRHAVTKFAHLHFPANRQAAERIVRMGEDPETVHAVGCPRIDLVARTLEAGLAIDPGELPSGVGDPICVDEPFVLVSQHPVTTEYERAEAQMSATLEAVREWGVPAIVLWPNADAGSDGVSRAIRKMREQGRANGMHFYKNLPTDVYVRLMARTKCLVGNSSSAIREGAFVGVPAVNVGTRQSGRQRSSNVIDAPHDCEVIVSAIRQQNEKGRYASDPIYGDGRAGQRIADILATRRISIQKKLAY